MLAQVRQRLGRQTFNAEIVGPTASCALLRNHLRQVVHSLVPLSPSSNSESVLKPGSYRNRR